MAWREGYRQDRRTRVAEVQGPEEEEDRVRLHFTPGSRCGRVRHDEAGAGWWSGLSNRMTIGGDAAAITRQSGNVAHKRHAVPFGGSRNCQRFVSRGLRRKSESGLPGATGTPIGEALLRS